MSNRISIDRSFTKSLKIKHGLIAWVLAFAAIAGLTSRLPGTRASEEAHGARRAQLWRGLDLPKNSYVPGEVLVRFRAGTSEHQKLNVHAFVNAQVVNRFDSVPHLERVRLPEGTGVEEAVAKYRASSDVLYAEPNYIVHALQTLTIPNDPQFFQQWNLHNTGQNGGTPGADIHAPEAWSFTTGSTSVVAAVIDSGVDYTHPDLASQIWSAPSSFTVTQAGGGVITCPAGAHGFNALNGSCDPQDDVGHGTHVSGILGAATNNAVGVGGVNWNIQILPCKFINSQGFGFLSGELTCLDMVKSLKDSGVNIVVSNNSWGEGAFSQSLSDAIAAQQQSGILFIAAAGNSFMDTDLVPLYPADYGLPNVISVAASTNRDEFAGFSNVGRRTTHLSAPGDQILSTTPNNTYSVFSGTSMSAPHVAGVAALLKAQDPTRDWRAIKNLLLSGGDTVPALDSTITGKRLNAAGSLNCSNRTVQTRTLPIEDTIPATVGNPVILAALSINCAQAAGPVSVTVSPGGQTVTLADDGANPDQAAGDGIFTAQWTPPSIGSYAITFPWGDAVQVEVLAPYSYQPEPSTYVTMAGTNLNLGDDSIVQISSPFPIAYGGGTFAHLFIGSNGTISFTDAYSDFNNQPIPPREFPPFAIPQPTTLVAPWWQDLFPVKGSAQNVFWDVVGATPNRQLVVEWRDVRSFHCKGDTTTTIKFQVVFFEGKSDVEFNYADAVFGGNCSAQDHGGIATVGLQESLKTGQMYSYFGQTLVDGSSLLWTIPSSTPTPNPSPTLNSISPPSVPRGGTGLTLTVNGSNFVPASRVQYIGSDRITTFVSSTVLTAQLDAADLDPFQTPVVDVFTPGPGGGTSQQLQLTLVNPVPVITSLSPVSATAGGLTFDLIVRGSGFQFGGAHVLWNGQGLASGAVDPNTMVAQVEYGLMAAPGTAQITVQNGGPGGGTSNALTFTINAPQATPTASGNAAAPSPAQIQAIENFGVDSAGQVHAPPGQRSPRPMRFLGWNYGRKMGPAYMKYFARAHGGTAIPIQNEANPDAGTTVARGTVSALAPHANLSGSASQLGFGLRPTLPADYLPTGVATGDFNRDGKLDWVVCNGGSNTVWVYLGKGDGSSQLPTIIPLVGQTPIQVIAVDLRKTGVLDLVLAEADTGSVGILLGNGDGTFQPETFYYAPGPVISVAAGDFDGDGKVDIVAGLLGDETMGPVAFFKGDGKGSLGTAVTRPSENSVGAYFTNTIQAIDLNNDGFADLVTTDLGSFVDGVHVYLSEGDGTFKESDHPYESYFAFALNAVAADMDGDGCPDIVTSIVGGIVYVFHGNCDGTFQNFPNMFFAGSGNVGAGLVLADVNGDGHLDVVLSGVSLDQIGGSGSDSVAVLFGDGHGKLAPGQIYRGEPGMFSLAVGDLNGDGKLDVVTANQDSDSASVYINDGKGGFGDPWGAYVGLAIDGRTGSSFSTPFGSPIVMDVNGDGKPDIAFLQYPQPNPYSWKLVVLLNDGTGHFGTPLRFDAMEGTFMIAGWQLADFRGTGKSDLVVLGLDSGYNPYLAFSPNHGDGTFGPVKIVKLTGSPLTFVTGDFNGDGKLDVILAGQSQSTGLIDRLTFMKGNGDGTFSPGANIDFGPQATTGGFPAQIFAGDFNGDHKLDLIVSVYDGTYGPGSRPHPVFELFGNGDGTFQQPVTIFPDLPLNAFFALADLNHDGRPDLIELVQPITTTSLTNRPAYKIYLGQPDGSFQESQTYSPFNGLILGLPYPILADFNGDGNLDILVPQHYPVFNEVTSGPTFDNGYFQILFGNGDGTFTPDYAVFNLSQTLPPNVAVDVNGDGRADLIEVDTFPSFYNVILANAGSTIQAQLVSDPVVGNKGFLRLNLGLPRSTATTVTLSASDSNINIASSVTIPAGSVAQDVPFTIATAFNPLHVFALRAQLGTDTAVAYGTVAQPGLSTGFQLFLLNTAEATAPGSTTPDYGLGLLSVNAYSTSLQLQCQGLPAGATCQFFPNPAVLLPGTSGSGSVSIAVAQGTALGTYPFTIVASDGNLTSQIAAKLILVDFSVSLTPASQVTLPGQPVNYSLMLTPLNSTGLAVQLSCPVTPPGPKCSLDGAYVVSGQRQLTIDTQSAPVGDYSFTVTGTSVGVSHSASAQLRIENAALTLSKTSATVPVGSSTNVNVTLTSANGFTDQFTFSCPSVPAGVSCSFNPSPAPLLANGTLTSVLTIAVNSRPAAGAAYLPFVPWPRMSGRMAGVAGVLLALFLTMAFATKRVSGRFEPAWGRAICSLTVFLLACLSACGGSSTGPPPPPPPPPVIVNLHVQASSPSLTSTSGAITITIP